MGNNEAKRVRLSQEGPQESYILKGEVNSDFTEWLSRSLVYTSEEPRDLGALSTALVSGFGECTKICTLSSFKFILTMPTQERMDELLSNHEELDLWFVSVKKWDKCDFCKQEEFGLRFLEFHPMDGHGRISKKLPVFGEDLFVWANPLED